MTDFDALLAAMTALEAERTPGAWTWDRNDLMGENGDVILYPDYDDQGSAELVINDGHREWIALASRFVPAAIAEIARLRREESVLRAMFHIETGHEANTGPITSDWPDDGGAVLD
jgi:hypothetical protein